MHCLPMGGYQAESAPRANLCTKWACDTDQCSAGRRGGFPEGETVCQAAEAVQVIGRSKSGGRSDRRDALPYGAESQTKLRVYDKCLEPQRWGRGEAETCSIRCHGLVENAY